MRQRHLIIAGQRWRIVWCKAPRVEGKVVRGYSNAHAQRIAVSTKQAPDGQRVTLLHEVVHSIHSAGTDTHPRIEDTCANQISSGLYQIIREAENAWLVDYLREEP